MAILDFLEESGVKYELSEHPPAFTAQQMAAVEHEPGRYVAKPVVVKADDRYIMCVLSASYKIDLRALKSQLGAKVGIAVGFIDAGKGALAILIAQAANIPQIAILFAGTAAVVGHNWPVFIGFRGGRGESPAIGILLMVITQPMLIIAGPALATLIIVRNIKDLI